MKLLLASGLALALAVAAAGCSPPESKIKVLAVQPVPASETILVPRIGGKPLACTLDKKTGVLSCACETDYECEVGHE